jgi:predicted transcriptional regulator
MTDETTFASAVRICVADSVSDVFDLADDPADHRGILSWHSQKREYSKPDKEDEDLSFRNFKGGQLNEAGSYGYLIQTRISPDALRKAQAEGTIRIRLEVDDSLPGGLAIYGERFGRYPLDPTFSFVLKN